MNMITNLLSDLFLISMILTFSIELSGFGEELKNIIWKMFLYPKHPKSVIPDKPFFCPLCLTFWFGLIYLLVVGQFNLIGITMVCFISYLTPVTATFMMLIRDLFIKVLDALYGMFS